MPEWNETCSQAPANKEFAIEDCEWRCPTCGTSKGALNTKDAEIAALRAQLEAAQKRANERINANYEANAEYVHRLELGVEELADRAGRAEIQLEAAQRDTARLSWLEQKPWDDELGFLVREWKWNGKRYPAGLRAAIDAAMSEAKHD